MGCAVFSAVTCVGVSPSPCVGVSPLPCAGTSGPWARPGVVCAVSGPGCGGASRWACASGVVCLVARCGHVRAGSRGVDWVGGGGGAGPSGVVSPSMMVSVLVPIVVPCPPVQWPLAFFFSLCWWSSSGSCPPCCVAPSALSLWAPACYLAPLLTPLPPAFSLPFPNAVCWGWGGGDACGVPMAHARKWVVWSHQRRVSGVLGAAEALDRNPEEGFPCRLRHGSLKGCLVGVRGGAGEDFLKGVGHVHPLTPSRSPGPLLPAVELLQGGGRPPREVGGGQGRRGLPARSPRAAVAGAWGGGCVSVARGTGSAVLFLGGGGRGHGTAVARVVALGGAGTAEAGPWGVLAAPRGAGATRLSR